MIAHRFVLAALACLLLLAGCSGSDDDAATAAEPTPAAAADDGGDAEGAADEGAADEEGAGSPATDEADAADEPRTFAAGDPIPMSLTLLATEDGGRRTGIYSGYRPTVTFAEQEPLTCSASWPEGGAFEPGETRDVEVTCPEAVTLEPEEVDVTVEEGGRLIGTGAVLP